MADWSIRLDRFLWFARIAKTRSLAQALAEKGHLRIDGRPVNRSAAPVRIGNILTFATQSGDIRTIRVELLPIRRGSPSEALACYQDLAVANVSQKAASD